MAAPIIIAAGRPLWDELLLKSGLPASLFCTEPPLEFSESGEDRMIFCGESLFDAESLSVDEVERLDRLLFACRDGSFVWLHKCTKEPEQEIEKILRASKAWSNLVAQRKRRYESFIRPVVVIIGGDSTTGEELDFRKFLQKFESARSQIAFKDIFIMAPRLEPAGREIFHARNIWPISVSRLLLFLSARKPKIEAPTVYAWRFREFRHTEPGILYDRLLPACSDALFDKLRVTGRPASLPVWSPSQGCLKLDAEAAPTSPYWHAFPAIAEADHSTDPGRILERLSEAGADDAERRATSVLERWKQRDKLIGSFWEALHGEAGAAWQTETALRTSERPSLAELGKKSDGHLELLPTKIQALKSAGESLKTGAAELAVAQSWFVQRWFRLAIALIAASLLGVMFFRGAQLKFENLYMAGVVAAGCFLGALFAAALFYGLEVWRGEKGVKEWADRKRDFEVALAGLNENLCGLKTAASSLSAGFANATLHSKLLRLVSRLTSAVASVFQTSASSSSASPGDAAVDTGKTAIRYLEKSTIRLGRNNDLANETDLDLANHAVSKLMETDFFAQLSGQWKKVCEHSDAPPNGAVNAAELHATLVDIMAGLPSEVDQIVSESNRKSSLWKDLHEALEELKQREHDFGLLSVELSDTAQPSIVSHLLVSSAYALESGEMNDADALAVPEKAETVCPVLLVEISAISTGGDLTPLNQSVEAEPK
jgi:hypothetical protein